MNGLVIKLVHTPTVADYYHIIREEKGAKAPWISAEISEKRNESDLPVSCTLKSQNSVIGCIQGKNLLSPVGEHRDDIYPCEGKYGVYYRFEEHKNAILTKSRNGSWLLKEKKDGKYEVVGAVSSP